MFSTHGSQFQTGPLLVVIRLTFLFFRFFFIYCAFDQFASFYSSFVLLHCIRQYLVLSFCDVLLSGSSPLLSALSCLLIFKLSPVAVSSFYGWKGHEPLLHACPRWRRPMCLTVKSRCSHLPEMLWWLAIVQPLAKLCNRCIFRVVNVKVSSQ